MAVPVFTRVELSELAKACQGRSFASFAARRDAAIIAVFIATGIRPSELAGIRHHPGDPARSDLDLQGREIRIRGKGGMARTVKIGHQAARSLDRYLRARARHAQAHRPQLWLGVNNQGPLTATGIYQIVARRGRVPGASLRPRPWPSRRVNYRTTLYPGCSADSVSDWDWRSPRRSPAHRACGSEGVPYVTVDPTAPV